MVLAIHNRCNERLEVDKDGKAASCIKCNYHIITNPQVNKSLEEVMLMFPDSVRIVG